MKKLAVIILLLGAFIFSGNTAHCFTETPTKLPTLTVDVGGDGTVVSYPPGIECINRSGSITGTCSYKFPANTSVALLAQDPTDLPEGWVSFFCGWNIPTAETDQIAAYSVIMDASKTVTATFCPLAPPAFALPPPENTDVYGPYMPIADPYMSIADESQLKPIAINEKADGSFEIIVGLPPYFGADEAHGVDVYVGISIPGFADVWQIIPGPPGIVSNTTALAPWKTNISDKIDDELVMELPAALLPLLPRGAYFVHLMVTPTGDTSAYTAWSSYFVLDRYMSSPFLIPLP